MSTIREIADSLADGLAAVTWSIAGTAVERKNWVSVDIEQMAQPVVYVVPGNASVARVSRNVSQTDYTVTVFIGRHVQTDAEVDEMIDLADDIVLHIRAHDWFNAESWPDGVSSPVEIEIELNPDDGLNERNAWRAVVTATYRTFSADELPEV